MKTFLKIAGIALAGYLAFHFFAFLVGKIFLVGAVAGVGYMFYKARQHKKSKVIDSYNFRSMYARDDEKEHNR